MSAALNAGQALILAAGLTGVLVAAANVAAITPGDLVRGCLLGLLPCCCDGVHRWRCMQLGGHASCSMQAGGRRMCANAALRYCALIMCFCCHCFPSQVFIQGMLIQLWAPLQFLGWFYRELRQVGWAGLGLGGARLAEAP